MSMAASRLQYNRLVGSISAKAVIRRINYSSTSAINESSKNNVLDNIPSMLHVNLCAKTHKFMRFNLFNTSRARGAYLQSLTSLPLELTALPPQFALPSTHYIY